jgi:hypothetical protein
VITWNTVYYQKVLGEFAREGYSLRDEVIAHLWPTRYAHINLYGKYTIDVDGELAQAGDDLRPLRPA